MMLADYDDVVIGAGIVGLAHAYHLARRGRRVVVLERHPQAQGASIRNFGMLWPIGRPSGDLQSLALRSRTIWLEVLAEAGIWHARSGSLHLAYADDEARVLVEFEHEEHLQFGIHVLVSQNETCPRRAISRLKDSTRPFSPTAV